MLINAFFRIKLSLFLNTCSWYTVPLFLYQPRTVTTHSFINWKSDRTVRYTAQSLLWMGSEEWSPVISSCDTACRPTVSGVRDYSNAEGRYLQFYDRRTGWCPPRWPSAISVANARDAFVTRGRTRATRHAPVHTKTAPGFYCATAIYTGTQSVQQ